ncbi:unnamed protein product [Pleuronectes platessa]|uniref:Uncharacterized protein n=1 Tax=Pleuronectes platessa TaxID=8262 RepID=A0A9N7Y585_PLEPL|nr:unnamed protein product [Pleuronectes platessa]
MAAASRAAPAKMVARKPDWEVERGASCVEVASRPAGEESDYHHCVPLAGSPPPAQTVQQQFTRTLAADIFKGSCDVLRGSPTVTSRPSSRDERFVLQSKVADIVGATERKLGVSQVIQGRKRRGLALPVGVTPVGWWFSGPRGGRCHREFQSKHRTCQSAEPHGPAQ